VKLTWKWLVVRQTGQRAYIIAVPSSFAVSISRKCGELIGEYSTEAQAIQLINDMGLKSTGYPE